MSIGRRVANGLERTIYVIAGLPIALHGVSIAPTPHARIIRRAFADRYWHPKSFSDTAALLTGLPLVPLAVPLAALWFTMRNGPAVRWRAARLWRPATGTSSTATMGRGC